MKDLRELLKEALNSLDTKTLVNIFGGKFPCKDSCESAERIFGDLFIKFGNVCYLFNLRGVEGVDLTYNVKLEQLPEKFKNTLKEIIENE